MRTADEDREVTPEELKAFFWASKHRGKWERAKSEAKEDKVDKKTIRAFWKKAVSVGLLNQIY